MAAAQLITCTFGRSGSNEGQFGSPTGVTVSQEGEIFVADKGNHRIQVFNLEGTFVRLFPTVVRGEIMDPSHVAKDSKGNLWVVGRTHEAQFAAKYDKQGKLLQNPIALECTPLERGVAVNTRNNVGCLYISETTGEEVDRHGHVLVFGPDGQAIINGQGMKNPEYMTVDGEGNLLVSDWGDCYIYVFNKNGQFLSKFNKIDGGKLDHPKGICTDNEGNVIVADWGSNRVEKFDKKGKFLKHIGAGMNFNGPQAVAMAENKLVVTHDSDNENKMVTIIPYN